MRRSLWGNGLLAYVVIPALFVIWDRVLDYMAGFKKKERMKSAGAGIPPVFILDRSLPGLLLPVSENDGEIFVRIFFKPLLPLFCIIPAAVIIDLDEPYSINRAKHFYECVDTSVVGFIQCLCLHEPFNGIFTPTFLSKICRWFLLLSHEHPLDLLF